MENRSPRPSKLRNYPQPPDSPRAKSSEVRLFSKKVGDSEELGRIQRTIACGAEQARLLLNLGVAPLAAR